MAILLNLVKLFCEKMVGSEKSLLVSSYCLRSTGTAGEYTPADQPGVVYVPCSSAAT